MALPPQRFQIRRVVCPPPPSARQLASTRRWTWQSTDCQSQPPAKRCARTPLPSSPSARGERVATHPHWGDGSIALSTCMARLVNQAAGLLSLLPRRRHPLWPARLCRRHQPGPRHHGSTTLMAYCPAGTTTAVQTLRPTPTSPPPPRRPLLPPLLVVIAIILQVSACSYSRNSDPDQLAYRWKVGTADYSCRHHCCQGIRRLLLPLSLIQLIVKLL